MQLEATHARYKILNPATGRRGFKFIVDPAHLVDIDVLAKAVSSK